MDSHDTHFRDFVASRIDMASLRDQSATAPAPSAASRAPLIQRRVGEGLLYLLKAKEYADDVEVDLWDFALELRELRSLGLTNSDLRWLVMKGYVEFGRETTEPGDERRSFRRSRGLTFVRRNCFVITPAGEAAATAFALQEQTAAPTVRRVEPIVPPEPPRPQPRVTPHWDSDLQELRINGLIVKQYKVPAPNQEMVLAAFEEENWPVRIDDPLPPQVDQDPKRRLHDTIVSLNRNHKHRLIRFMGDGSGEGVRWTVVTDETSSAGDEE